MFCTSTVSWGRSVNVRAYNMLIVTNGTIHVRMCVVRSYDNCIYIITTTD